MSTQASQSLPFAGLRVLDVSQGLAGPYCGALLAQYGATVVKLEPPEGDWSRGIGQRHGTHSAIDLMANRGKRSLAVDLKRPDAAALVRRMAAQCDVMIESYRPGIAERLGIGYAQIAAAQPGIVYVSISGFGQTGAMAAQPATDTVIQGFSGLMALTPDPEGRPQRLGFLAVDTLTALYAFQATSVALYARRGGAPGRHLDISLMQSTAAFLTHKIVEAGLEGGSPVPLNVPAGVYRTQDGWIAITLSKEAHFQALCAATGREDLAADPALGSFVSRARQRERLEAEFARILAARDTDDWLAVLQSRGVVASRVNRLVDWLDDAHVQASGIAPMAHDPDAGSFRYPLTPGLEAPAPQDPRARWPGVGSDGTDILRTFGLQAHEIDALRQAGTLI